MRTLLHDPVPEALERAPRGCVAGWAKMAEKGRLDDAAAAEARAGDCARACSETWPAASS